MIGNIVGGFIIILIGSTLAPVVATTVWGATVINGNASLINNNMSSASITVLSLTTLFYNLSIASSAIGVAAQGLKNSGLM